MRQRRNPLGQWMADFRWAMNMMRARRIRRGLGFSERQRFDLFLRPRLDPPNVIAYPDAFYHTTVDDLIRAMRAAGGGVQ